MSRVERCVERFGAWCGRHGCWYFRFCELFIALGLLEVAGVKTPLQFILVDLDSVRHSLTHGLFAGTILVGILLCDVRLTFYKQWDRFFGG